MMRNTKFVKGEYYHIYNRGVDKREIFMDSHDCKRFVKGLYVFNTQKDVEVRDLSRSGKNWLDWERGHTLVNIGAYCLMPNHFHVLVREQRHSGVSTFMKKLSTSYTMYFNKKYERTGRLFEGSFKSVHIDSDRYLKYLFAYIHLNPVKLVDKSWKEGGFKDTKKVREYLGKYTYSSYLDYCGEKRLESKILNEDKFPRYFEKKGSFIKEMEDWLGCAEVKPPHE